MNCVLQGRAESAAEVERLRVANASLEMQVEDLRQEVLTLSEELEQAEEEVANKDGVSNGDDGARTKFPGAAGCRPCAVHARYPDHGRGAGECGQRPHQPTPCDDRAFRTMSLR